VVFLGALVLSGGSVALRSASEAVAGLLPSALEAAAAIVIYVVWLSILHELGAIPLSFYSGFVLERRYGLSRQAPADWARDQAKGLALTLVLGAGAASILYFLIHRFPVYWWLPAGLVFAGIVVGLANLGPVLLLPLFYTVKPLGRESLRARLLALAERAGARVLDVFEWGLGEKTTSANAALAGLGRTRRILVSDTMLSDYSDDEIEVVLAHELAHHVHGDIWKGIVLESCLVLTGFLAAAALLRGGAAAAGLRGADDVAGLPLLLLAAGAVSVVTLPAANALSRAHERRADRFALTLTGNASAFISAMRRLASQNLADEEPSAIVKWLFYSHPATRERIAFAQAFAQSVTSRKS
jgi:STE24 endopeptidase